MVLASFEMAVYATMWDSGVAVACAFDASDESGWKIIRPCLANAMTMKQINVNHSIR